MLSVFDFLTEGEGSVRASWSKIDLSEFDLSIPHSDALRYYGEIHTELCTEFMMNSVKRAGYDELLRVQGPTKDEFVTYLEK